MEIAVSHHQPLFGATVQHPLLQGAVIYPGKGSAWQPVVTSLPPMAELPKESIIANTDFTTTSGLAKRRLSSKKRKKLENQQHRHSGCDNTLSDGPANSPNDSAYGSCPSVSSTTGTPPSHDRTELRNSLLKPAITTITSSQHQPLLHSSTSSFHPMVVHHPHTHSQTTASRNLHSETSTLQNHGNCPPNTTVPSLLQNQYPIPVLSQLQQELNYRFLSNGGQAPQQVESSNRKSSGVKWCNAHVSVAKMIQQHQLEAQAMPANPTASQPQPHDVSTVDPSMDTTNSIQHTSQSEPVIAMSAQQQQQLALLQMYGMHTNMSTAAAVQPGYLAVPYSTMHDVPVVQFAAVPQIDGTNSIAMIKPGLPGHPVQMGQQFGHAQNIPLAAAAVDSSGGLVMQGGSWMAPVPMMGGSCVINPLHPGVLAAPWVK